ncbi:nucleoside-diphosphate-sugar epimerase [Roseibium hamelinense]|uniref:Nucleoside-diphosphate-sugar epimerase n=1 Tax=Roseibium hamelinense TaxID=150831 RepID=A0A562TII5_9HYPH|nr:SDR family oxidoreductase [Roseibium hamelinense]MTI42783.1 SDR family oxidoreductase [Roseibium hamelinense]TWI93432.1 nucleoside-diphosphate-sugar epimerase [Roseibium hamelinense]
MTKKALIIGGAGFIGSHLLERLAASGEYDALVCADIRPPRFSVKGVDYKTMDATKPLHDDMCPGVTEIYNLAAVHTTPGHDDWEYYWTNVMAATHTVAFATRMGCQTIVFASSISIYGPTEAPLDEASPLAPDSAYGKSKYAAEEIHRAWAAEHPETRKLVIVRPAVIYGYEERGNFTRLAGLLKKGRFVYPGRKDTIKSCGYVKDLVRSIAFALNRPEKQLTYNFAYPDRTTSEQICAAFDKVAGYGMPKAVLPLWPMLLAAFGFEVMAKLGLKTSINRARIMKLNRSTNVVPQTLVDLGFDYSYDLEASLTDWLRESETRRPDAGGFV